MPANMKLMELSKATASLKQWIKGDSYKVVPEVCNVGQRVFDQIFAEVNEMAMRRIGKQR